MTDLKTQKKWDRMAKRFDFMSEIGTEKRWGPYKRELYSHMGDGKILFLAVGTGLDIQAFPPGKNIIGIDISPKMLEQARPRAEAYPGELELRTMDIHDMPFEEGEFDQIFTSCTFCSVPRPIEGLRSLYRVLKPGGELNMFEHTGSRVFPINVMMHLMTLLSRQFGPDMNRDTVANVLAAGFELRAVEHVYLDVVKCIRALKPA